VRLTKVLFALGCAGMFVSALQAQQIPDLKVGNDTVQFHAFASQGFAYTNDNNYLTMNTSNGSAAFTEFGFNASMQVTNKLRVGAQMYDRNIGQLGGWHPTFDWGYADYRFNDWFGIRAGKVKTALGLFNDTQDTEALYTWALLPQSVYPIDLRSNNIAHTGGDVYGSLSLHKAGTVGYTAYIGARSFDPYGGYNYFSANLGIPIVSNSGRAAGTDVRWTTPVTGLMVGGSFMDQTQDRKGYYTTLALGAPLGTPYSFVANPQRTSAAYGDYTRGNWHLNAEFRRDHYIGDISTTFGPVFPWNGSDKAWFVSAAYRINKHLELGAYHSHYTVDAPFIATDPNSNHIYDEVATARVDVTSWWDVKIEGHFMNGYGDMFSAHGFYVANNPQGMKPSTDMLVIRTGVNF